MFPIIFHSSYKFVPISLRWVHPFDLHKFQKVYTNLQNTFGHEILKKNTIVPTLLTDRELECVHSKEYLDQLKDKFVLAEIAEVAVGKYIPLALWEHFFLKTFRRMCEGTRLALFAALETGGCIHLGGGFHHAKYNSSSGFCFYSDVAYGIFHLRKKNPSIRIAHLDLDAHQGNGISDSFANDPQIWMGDLFNSEIYPQDYESEANLTISEKINSSINDDQYLLKVENLLLSLKEFAPELLIYNAGTDILSGDPLGMLNISKEGLLKRDKMVIEFSLENTIPWVYLCSGGYSYSSSEVLTKSFEFILSLNQ